MRFHLYHKTEAEGFGFGFEYPILEPFRKFTSQNAMFKWFVANPSRIDQTTVVTGRTMSLSIPATCFQFLKRHLSKFGPFRHSIVVTFGDGNKVYTSINGTRAEVLEYYLGKSFQFGDTEACPQDNMQKATHVQFL